MFSGVSTGGDNEGDVEVMFSGLASIVTGVGVIMKENACHVLSLQVEN